MQFTNMHKAFVLFGFKKDVESKEATFTSDEVNYNYSWSTNGTVKATGEDVVWDGKEKVWRLKQAVQPTQTATSTDSQTNAQNETRSNDEDL